METKKAIDIVNAMATLADALGMEVTEVGSYVAFFDDERREILNEALAEYYKFQSASIVERGAMLGITITEHEGGALEASTVLSES